jgi:hypothetical protein
MIGLHRLQCSEAAPEAFVRPYKGVHVVLGEPKERPWPGSARVRQRDEVVEGERGARPAATGQVDVEVAQIADHDHVRPPDSARPPATAPPVT